ncbi:hypothetical protein, partial [Novacetimonas hansenii]
LVKLFLKSFRRRRLFEKIFAFKHSLSKPRKIRVMGITEKHQKTEDAASTKAFLMSLPFAPAARL